jgi:hypothetical protein
MREDSSFPLTRWPFRWGCYWIRFFTFNIARRIIVAYSHGWGYFFRNTYSEQKRAGIKEYIDRIRQRGLAIETGYRLDPLEQAASRLVAGIRAGITLPSPIRETEAYLADSVETLNSLCNAGLIEVGSMGTYSLTELGSLFEEEICSLFYSPSIKTRLLRKAEWWAPQKLASVRRSIGGIQ